MPCCRTETAVEGYLYVACDSAGFVVHGLRDGKTEWVLVIFKALADLEHHRVLFAVLQGAWVSGGCWLRVLLIVICRPVTVPAPSVSVISSSSSSLFPHYGTGCGKSVQGLHYGRRPCVLLRLQTSISLSWSHRGRWGGWTSG